MNDERRIKRERNRKLLEQNLKESMEKKIEELSKYDLRGYKFEPDS